ncbi:MAG: hypothetical protein WB697_24750 [Stellaceae bacterium]
MFGDLELDRPAGLPLDDRRPILHPAPDADITDPKPHEVAAPELIVDREVEQREIAFALFKLEPNADGPDFSGSQRALLTDETALVPRGFGKADKGWDRAGHGLLLEPDHALPAQAIR